MKIAHIVHHFPPESNAGCELYGLTIATLQAAKGHEVRVYTRAIMSTALSPTFQKESYQGISVVRFVDPVTFMDDWDKFYNKYIEERLRDELQAFAPDIVHIHHWVSLTLSLLKLCKELSLTTVLTLHDFFATCPTGHRMHRDGYFCENPVSIEHCYRCLLIAGENPQKVSNDERVLDQMIQERQQVLSEEIQKVDGIIVSSSIFLEYVKRWVPIETEKVKILPMYATHLNLPPSRPSEDMLFHIVYFGAVNKYKAPHLILDAVHTLKPNLRENIKISLFGYIHPKEYAEKLLEKSRGLDLFLSGTVYQLSELPQHTFDIAIFPSIHFESFSFTMHEAIQMELPVIVSDIGIPASRINNCGLTFRHGDPEDLGEKIAQLMLNRQLRRQCEEACKKAKETFFSPEQHTMMLLDYYTYMVRKTPFFSKTVQ